jgi:hypothetical protein
MFFRILTLDNPIPGRILTTSAVGALPVPTLTRGDHDDCIGTT